MIFYFQQSHCFYQTILYKKLEGVGIVGIHNSTHFGASAQYVQQAIDADMIAMVMQCQLSIFALVFRFSDALKIPHKFSSELSFLFVQVFTNSSPALPPHGGAAPFLGASPIAAGAPAGSQHSFLMDMSTTVIARGKLRLGKLFLKIAVIFILDCFVL